MFKRKNKRGGNKFSEKDIFILKRVIINLPFDNIDESRFQSLLKNVECVNVKETQVVLDKGKLSPGLYIVVAGQVEGISVRGRLAIRFFRPADFFGDLSTFFSIPSPLTVSAKEGAELLFIKSEDVLNVLSEKANVDLFQWFIRRKYVDTGKVFKDGAVLKELAYQALQETPMFLNWSSDCLHFLVEQTLPEIIVLFPSGSYIWREGDHACEIFILVQGTAKIFTSENKELVTISSTKASFSLGEEQYFRQSKRIFDVWSESPCLVLIVSRNHLDYLFHSDIQCNEELALYDLLSHRWESLFTQRNKSLYSKYLGQLDLEVTSIKMWQALVKCGMEVPFQAGFFHMLFLLAHASEVDVGEGILVASELNDVAVLIIKGRGEITLANQRLETIETSELYLPKNDCSYGDEHWFKAVEPTVVLKIPYAVIRSAQEQYPRYDVF